MQVIAKLARMVGLDQLHIGTAVGEMYGGEEEINPAGIAANSSTAPRPNTFSNFIIYSMTIFNKLLKLLQIPCSVFQHTGAYNR